MTSLATHVDDSTYTINLCVGEAAFAGAALVFNGARGRDAAGPAGPPFRYEHARHRGLVHRGNLQHHVEELTAGEREAVIIWVTLEGVAPFAA